MSLASGTRLGPYEIHSALGAGGMGEVYRARDTRLKRDVALKILRDSFAADPDRLARFQREAEVLASLNHPHIAAIYGLEEDADTRALVLELVEGPTLADRIARGPVPLEDALAIARQIAEALEAAHEHGVIHRDLKPANVKVREDATVKVRDFGLAKLTDVPGPRPQAREVTASPTLTSPAMMTGVGMILGTAAYMAPEQAKGMPADARSDIWSFGAVLYEMLSGRPAFGGDTVVEILGGIIKTDPEWSALPAEVAGAVRSLLRRCLEKDRKRRLRHIADARFQIEDALSQVPSAPAPVVPRKSREPLAWTVAAAAGVLALAAAPLFLRAPAALPEMRVEITTPSTPDPISFAISRDGRQLAFVASGDGDERRLWIRRLDAETAQSLAGTEGATYPFWSPDGQSLGFFADGQLKRIDVAGGPVRALASVRFFRGGAWGADGVIVFNGGPLRRVSASGGPVTAATALAPGQTGHRFPQFLPGGRQFVFFAQVGSNDPEGIYLGSIDSPEIRFLAASETAGAYHPSGHLLFVRQGSLVAQRFDVERAALVGDPMTVATAVASQGNFGVGAFSVSDTGVIAYRAGGTSRQLVWLDRSGRELGVVGAADEAGLLDVQLSRDGRRAVVRRTLQRNRHLWLVDLARSAFTRFTFDPGEEASPTWSPDGSRIAFASDRAGVFDIYVKPSSGAGNEELLWRSQREKRTNDWSPDGRFLLYEEAGSESGTARVDLWILPVDGQSKPSPFVNTPASEINGQFSPDGRWVAYRSNESGRDEIYVQAFPNTGGKWQISTSGGIEVRWSPDGRELFYIAPDARLMAVPVQARGEVFEPGTPVALFQTRIALGGTVGVRPQYDVAPDGRFLMNIAVEAAARTPITLLLNWRPPAP